MNICAVCEEEVAVSGVVLNDHGSDHVDESCLRRDEESELYFLDGDTGTDTLVVSHSLDDAFEKVNPSPASVGRDIGSERR
jgi:hypothetical protein